jgi:hypothetical protein
MENSRATGDDGPGPGPPGGSPLLNLSDLAARWEISEREAIEVVRRRGVPFLRVTHAIDRVGWDKVRFLPASVEEREQARRATSVGSSPWSADRLRDVLQAEG